MKNYKYELSDRFYNCSLLVKYSSKVKEKNGNLILFKIAFSPVILLLFYLDIKICFVKSMCVLTLRLTLKIFDGGVI